MSVRMNFCDVFEDVTKESRKLQTSEYLEEGKYPIYDQGKNEIAGYTNEEEGLFSDVPVVLFGDHTRVVKYVDRPCFLGADGVKLLKPKILSANVKYLYYAVTSIPIPDTGYNRHFKWLKESTIIMPEDGEQKRVVDTLDRISSMISLRKRQLQKLDDLIKARFVEMFGDPVANPKGWITKPLLEMGSCKNGMNFHYDDSGVTIHCLGVGDFQDHSIIADTAALPTVSLNEMSSDEYLLQDDDVVFVRSNGNKVLVGRSVAVYPGSVPTTFSGFCIRYRKQDDSIMIPYLLRVLKAESVRAKMAGRGANIQNLNQQILGTIEVPLPPLDLQEKYAAFVSIVDKSKLSIQQSLEKLETLKQSLMQQYFG